MHEADDYLPYVRCSTEDQAEHGVSLEAQRAKVRAYAVAHNLPISRIVEDAGASAKSLDRPGMKEVIRYLENGGRGVIIAKLDRLTRSVRDWSGLVEDFFIRPDGPRLLSASEVIETRTASGRLVLNILMAVAQSERETTVERTEQAMGHKRSRGERLGTLPYGKSVGPDGKTLVDCPVEANALAFAKGLREKGWGLRDIADELDLFGFRPRSGGKWAISTLSQLMRGVRPNEGI
jgi:site-specific DNA recombinase